MRYQAFATLRRFCSGHGRAALRPLRRALHNSSKGNAEDSRPQVPHNSNATKEMRNADLTMINLDSVAQTVTYSGLWGAVWSFPKRKPFAFNFLLSGTLVPLADYNMQMAEGGAWDMDRSLLFFLFGLYNGTAMWVVYVSCFRRMFPRAIPFANLSWAEKLKDRAGQKQLFGQIAADLLLYVPTFYFSTFYAFKARLHGESMTSAFQKWKSNFWKDNFTSISFYLPGDILCFAVPAWLRMPVTHGITFGWNSLWSWMRGKKDR